MTQTEPVIAPSADIDANVRIGDRTRIWHLAQVRTGADIGADCIISRGAYIGSGVELGDGCKIQNYALIYEPAILGRGVFVGPAAVLTNDRHPRAANPDLTLKANTDWNPVGVHIHDGASIGARAVCIAPVTIGRWAMVAAGSVVTRDVADHALVAGVPAKQIGWVGRSGARLTQTDDHEWICPIDGTRYAIQNDQMIEIGPQPHD